jgi:hypothetical protein
MARLTQTCLENRRSRLEQLQITIQRTKFLNREQETSPATILQYYTKQVLPS